MLKRSLLIRLIRALFLMQKENICRIKKRKLIFLLLGYNNISLGKKRKFKGIMTADNNTSIVKLIVLELVNKGG